MIENKYEIVINNNSDCTKKHKYKKFLRLKAISKKYIKNGTFSQRKNYPIWRIKKKGD